MRIAILYIATGKYIVFWDEFFSSSEQYFLPKVEKHYFVFTDSTNLSSLKGDNIHLITHQQLGWPYDTLLRFETFLKAKEQLQSFDFIFFFNANMKFVSEVMSDEFLPDCRNDDGLLATLHPGYYNLERKVFPYENSQPKSLAYIPNTKGKKYFMGGLNGGVASAYLELIETLCINTQKDLQNGIIAKWHDESHLNNYLLDKNPKILSPSYGYPEGAKLPFEKKIIIRDKNKYGGHSFLRNQKVSLIKRLLISIKNLIRK